MNVAPSLIVPRPADRLERLLAPLDRLFNRVYGARYNPIYQTGPLTVGLFLVMTVTGLYQLYFYKIGAPYESVTTMQEQVWSGRWIRALHRYAADLAVTAAVLHALRMFLQGKTWGPRALAWITGQILMGLLLFIGWTGYVLVWDRQGQVIAMEGARLLDVLPVFSEPLRRSFITEEIVNSGFFFLNLFLHIALPLALLLFLWIHTVRLARPKISPPRPLLWGVIGALLVLSILWPAALPPKGDALSMLGKVEVDWFFSFWVPVARAVSPPVHLALWGALALVLFSVPLWWRHRPEVKAQPSTLEERFCTGCTQCYKDCPYEAIAMVPRTQGFGSEVVAQVSPELCVSCGICAGSCAPMQIGPAGRRGQEQLDLIEAFVAAHRPRADTVVVFTCRNGVGEDPRLAAGGGVLVYPALSCAGALHTSVLEYVLRKGAGGAYVLSCPERDCVFREGPKWLQERVYSDREAELKDRVDKRRVRIGLFQHSDLPAALADLAEFRRFVAGLAQAEAEERVDLDQACEALEVSHG
jgi:ferredoxin